MDRSDELSKRREALLALIDQYTTGEHADEDNMSAVAGFQMEVERIEDKMREMNLTVPESIGIDGRSDGTNHRA